VSTGLAWWLGITFDIQGLENVDKERPCVYMMNHQEGIDIACQGAIQPKGCVVIGKKELLYFPFLNIYILLAHNFLVDRKDHEKAIHTMEDIAKRMAQRKVSLFIYPEGTRSHSLEPNLLPFKKGGFRIAIDGQYPIVPVVVQNYSNVYSSTLKKAPGGTIKIRVLPPISTKGLASADMESLVERTRSAMLQTLLDISLDTLPRAAEDGKKED